MSRGRKAVLADIPQLLTWALDMAQLYPHLTPDKDKVRELLREVISGPSHFAQVIERDGLIVSGLLAVSQPHGWAQKQVSQIALWFSGERGDGRALLAAYREWVAGRPAIRAAGLMLDFEAPYWLAPFMASEGFRPVGGSLQWLRKENPHGLV